MKAPNLMSTVIFFASLAGLFGTAGMAGAAREDAARSAIAAQEHALMAAIEKGDSAAVANLFTLDAKLSVSSGVVSGRAGIAGFWQVALGGGLKRLVLTPSDFLGEGDVRVETGSYQAFGADRRELGHGQYLLAWVKEAGAWKISRDFAHGDTAPNAAPVPDRAGLPRDYATQLRVMGGTAHDERQGLTTVYANELAAAVAGTESAHYPNGSVIVMEFAEPLRDGEDQLLRDAHGQPLKGSITHIDVMRRGAGFGETYGASRAGEWEFASFRSDGTTLISSANAVHCAACHLKAGANKDFVFRLRSWEPVRGDRHSPVPASRQ
jgi:ketosteroid isomerase-like protein